MHAQNTSRNLHLSLSNYCKILYFNARSLLPKIDDLRAEVLSKNPSVVCVVESWLSRDVLDLEITITGYNIHRYDRNRHGGGIVLYVHSSLAWRVLMDGSDVFEFVSITVESPNTNNSLCICTLYRPPASHTSFLINFIHP